MNRELWERLSFTANNPLHYQCPVCKRGFLNPIYGKFIQKQEVIQQNDPPIENLGIVILRCSSCQYSVTMIAKRVDFVAEDIDEKTGLIDFKEVKTFIPKFIYPPLPIIRCDYLLPKKIKKQLEISFGLFFYDKESCAASIRKTIELILSDKGKKKNSLQEKINIIENQWLKNVFTGIKEMGNAGTHGNYDGEKIEAKDLLDGYELLEAILEEFYYKKQEVLGNKAENLKRKFPNPNKKES